MAVSTWQPAPKTLSSCWKNLSWWIVFVLSGFAGYGIDNGTLIAANSDTCQTQGTTMRTPGNITDSQTGSDIAQVVSGDEGSESLNGSGEQERLVVPFGNSSPKEGVGSREWGVEGRETPTPSLTSPISVNFERVPIPKSKLAQTCDAEIESNPQLEGQPTQSPLPLPSPQLPIEELDILPENDSDPELGSLRVRRREVQSPQLRRDMELGTLRLREREIPSPQLELAPRPQLQPTGYLLARVSYFQTSNVFSGIMKVDDGLFSSGLTIGATPALGPQTNLLVGIDGNMIQYIRKSQFNYNQLRFSAGIRQRLMRGMYGEIGWNNQKLFTASKGDRFLDEHSLRLALTRQDQLSKRLRLNTFYEFRLSFADPDSRSRIFNFLSVSLSYSIQNNLQVGLGYQFSLSNFTRREREDRFHRLLGRLTYRVGRGMYISAQGGLSSGGSSDPNIDFDSSFFSITYSVDLGRF